MDELAPESSMSLFGFDTREVSDVLGRRLWGFFSNLFGSLESASAELSLSFPDTSGRSAPFGKMINGLPLLRAFIANFPLILKRANWSGKSLLAAAITVESWFQEPSTRIDEILFLLSLHKLYKAIEVDPASEDLIEVLGADEVQAILEKLGIL